ncbi:MAG: type II secretion system protein GspE, partial [Wenzhouxiangellaceae bacterium]
GAVNRLVDMGVEPFLLSSTLIGLMAQRLVRRLDRDRAESFEITAEDLVPLGIRESGSVRLMRPRRDVDDPRGGYSGRTGIYELVAVGDEMRQAIHGRAAEVELERIARADSPSMLDDGWRKVRAGVTSLDELMRVTRQY